VEFDGQCICLINDQCMHSAVNIYYVRWNVRAVGLLTVNVCVKWSIYYVVPVDSSYVHDKHCQAMDAVVMTRNASASLSVFKLRCEKEKSRYMRPAVNVVFNINVLCDSLSSESMVNICVLWSICVY
jgi:hypothetical protein